MKNDVSFYILIMCLCVYCVHLWEWMNLVTTEYQRMARSWPKWCTMCLCSGQEVFSFQSSVTVAALSSRVNKILNVRERERNGNFRSSAGSGAGPGLESWSLPGSVTRVSASLSQVPECQEYQEAHVCVLSPILVKPDQPAQTLAAWPEKSGLDKETITYQSIRENKNAISTIDNFVHGCWFVSQ